MSTEEPIEPVDEDVAKLFDKERRAKAPDDALDRVWSRLGIIVPVPDTHAAIGSAHGWLASHALAVAVASFVVGGAAGVALHASLEKAPPLPVTSLDRPLPPLAPTTPSPVVSPLEPTPSPTVVPRAPVPPRPNAAASVPASLGPERDVLDRARTELAEGNARGALVLLEEHASRFPKPQLGEEREALAIQSLVALRRYDEARARAQRFHESWPESLFAPVIEAATGSIP